MLSVSTNFHVTGYETSWKMQCFHFFPLKSLCNQNWACRKIGQDQPNVMIYINYDGPESPMLHTKFRWNRSTGSRENDFFMIVTIYGHGGHLGHVTWTFRSPFLRMLHMKFGFDWPSSFRGEDLWNCERRTDGRTTDDRQTDAGAWVYYKLTCEPSAQVS